MGLRFAFAQTPADEIPPLAPPLPEIPPSAWEQHGWLLWIIIPALLMLAGLLVWLALRPGKPPVLPAPAAQARLALQTLQSQPESGAVLSQISQALRQYLINAFWLPPLEMTTSDFCAVLNKHEKINSSLAGALGDFLRACDERKFEPSANKPPLGAASLALELIGQTEALRAAARASVRECGGPSPLPDDQVNNAKRQRAGALQDADASSEHLSP